MDLTYATVIKEQLAEGNHVSVTVWVCHHLHSP